jgi:hypothetical protein
MNWKGYEVMRSRRDLSYYTDIFLEGLRKITKISVWIVGLWVEIIFCRIVYKIVVICYINHGILF